MEICRLCQCYILIYVIILSSIHCKTFSINEALAASETSAVTELPSRRISTTLIDKIRNKEPLGKNFVEINKLKAPLSIKELLEKRAADTQLRLSQPKISKRNRSLFDLLEERFTRNKASGLNPLKSSNKGENTASNEKYKPKHRKTYQIFIPLKTHKITPYQPFNTRKITKNQSVKREVIGRHKNEHKYTPLLKSIRLLFDDLLRPEPDEPSRTTRGDRHNTLSYSTKDHDIICQCTAIPKKTDVASKEEAIIASDTKTIEVTASPFVTPATSTTTNHPSISNISNIGSDPYIPLLSSRNSPSSRRNDNGITEGSSTTRDGGVERNFTRYNRDGEYNTEQRRNETGQRYDQENTSCSTGNSSGCIGPVRGNNTGRGISGFDSETQLPSKRSEKVEIQQIFSERNSTNIDVANSSETRREATEDLGHISIQDIENRTEGTLSTNKGLDIGESVQPIGNNANSDNGIGQYLTSHKRLFDGSGTAPEANQGVLAKNQERLELTNLPGELGKLNMSNANNKQIVMIIDSYSVASDKNHRIIKKSI